MTQLTRLDDVVVHKRLFAVLTRAIFRAVGVELVCDMNIDVPVKLECLVPLCEFVPDLQFIACQHGLDRHTWKSVFRCKKRWY